MENHFNKVARDWDKNQITIKRTDAIAADLRRVIIPKAQQRAMEFGAGTGLLSVALKDLFAEIVLMDTSSEMINVANERLIKENINHLLPTFFDLEKENYKDKTFDCIFSQMTLHHVKDVNNIITKFYNLLNFAGLLAIADLYEEDGSFHDFDFDGHKGFNPDYLVSVLKEAGFKEVTYKPCFEIVKLNSANIEMTYPIFLLLGKKA